MNNYPPNNPLNSVESDLPEPNLAERLADSISHEDAAQDVWDQHYDELIRLAERNLDRRLGRRLDADDVVNSAFKSFYRRPDQYRDKENVDIRRILQAIVVCKAREAGRMHSRQRRDFRREEPAEINTLNNEQRIQHPDHRQKIRKPEKNQNNGNLIGNKIADSSGKADVAIDETIELTGFVGKGATPDQVLILEEIVAKIPDQLRDVAILLLKGCNEEEIAKLIGRVRRTVVRRKSTLRKWLLEIENEQ